MTLTTRQRQVLEFIRASIDERGFPPSVREIGKALGLKSTSTVHAHLRKLRSKGLIQWDPVKPRTISITDSDYMRKKTVSVPLVGQVAAGSPLLAEENVEDYLPLPRDFAKGQCFLLRVRGSSMIGAGILDGDYVIARRQSSADNGDIVVALIEDEATVKRFYREEGTVRLQPENDTMEPLYVKDLKILGRVIGLLRRLT